MSKWFLKGKMAGFSNIDEKLKDVPWRGGLAVVGIGFVCATIVSTLLSQVFSPAIKSSTSSVASENQVQQNAGFNLPPSISTLNQASLDLILKRNIFNSEGSVEGDASANSDNANTAPTTEIVKTDMPIKLLGTIYGGDPYSGIAIVENSAKRTINSFLVGDTLSKDALLKEVRRERIIIDRQGRLEYADVERPEVPKNRRDRKTAKSAPAASGVSALATEPPPATFKEEGFERKGNEITMAQNYKQKLLSTDITKVLQDAKATPNMVGGELKGFSLTRIRKDSIYEKAGLQNNDIVEEVNGVPLNDAAQAIKLLQSLRNENRIDVRINRGGSIMTVTLNVQ
jgi:type II secretion system protein C